MAESDLLKEGVIIPAFLGALFAFGFSRIASWLTKIYENKAKGYRSLVLMQYVHQDLIYQIQDLFKISRDMKHQLSKIFEEKSVGVYVGNLPVLRINRDLLPDIPCLPFVNDVIGYFRNLHQINIGVEFVNQLYGPNRQRFQETGDQRTYHGNIPLVVEQINGIVEALPHAWDKNLSLLSMVIALGRKRPLFTIFLSHINSIRLSSTDFRRAKNELIELQKQVGRLG